MLSVTKNTLLNKVLQLEIAINEAFNDEPRPSDYHKDSERANAELAISRNIESIKQQLKNL